MVVPEEDVQKEAKTGWCLMNPDATDCPTCEYYNRYCEGGMEFETGYEEDYVQPGRDRKISEVCEK